MLNSTNNGGPDLGSLISGVYRVGLTKIWCFPVGGLHCLVMQSQIHFTKYRLLALEAEDKNKTLDYINFDMIFKAISSKDQRLSRGRGFLFKAKSSRRKASFLYYHWLEGRDRISYLLFSFAITSSVCYIYSLELIFLYVKPFLSFEKSFIFTELTEALYVTLEICIITSLSLVFPLLCYQAWCFLLPSFYNLERRGWSLFLLLSILFSFLALLSVYLLILPGIAGVLLQFEIKSQILTIQLEARIDSYVDWSSKIFLGVLVYGQLPLLSYIGFYWGLLSPNLLIRRRRPLLALSILISALLSPPDLLTQWLVTVSILFWTEAIIWLGMVFNRRGSRGIGLLAKAPME